MVLGGGRGAQSVRKTCLEGVRGKRALEKESDKKSLVKIGSIGGGKRLQRENHKGGGLRTFTGGEGLRKKEEESEGL